MSLRTRARRVINRSLRRYGYTLWSTKPNARPVSAEGIASRFGGLPLRHPVIVQCPMNHLRGLYWYPLSSRSHPFVSSLRDWIDGGAQQVSEIRALPLWSFYESCRPSNAAELLGLSAISRTLANVPPAGAVFPWADEDPASRLAHRNNVEEREARSHGSVLSADMGSKLCGPITEGKASLEWDRLIKVYSSIKGHGYRRKNSHDGDVGATLLTTAAGEWCLQIWQGHHRAAAAAVAGIDPIPVRIAETPVRREDVDAWPGVESGLFTKSEALEVFDRVLHGNPPPSMCWEYPGRSS
jgi:hypothetical protein